MRKQKNRKKTAKKTKTQKNVKNEDAKKKTKTHNLKNEDAYFQERRRKKRKRRRRFLENDVNLAVASTVCKRLLICFWLRVFDSLLSAIGEPRVRHFSSFIK